MSDIIKEMMDMAKEIERKYRDISTIEREMVNYYLSLSDEQKIEVSTSMIDIILISIAQSIGVDKMHVNTATEILRSIGEDSGACMIIEHLGSFYEELCTENECIHYNTFMDEMDSLYRKHHESMIHKITSNFSVDTFERKKTNQDIVRDAINDIE